MLSSKDGLCDWTALNPSCVGDDDDGDARACATISLNTIHSIVLILLLSC